MTKPLSTSSFHEEAQLRYTRACEQLAAAQAEHHAATINLLLAHRLQLRDDTSGVLGRAQLELEERLDRLEQRLEPSASPTP